MKRLYILALTFALGVSLTPAVSCQSISATANQATVAATAKKSLPAIQLHSSNKGKVDGSKLKYKAIIVDVWASWCGPCRKQIPVLHELQKQYGNKLQLLGISVDDNESDHKKAIKKLGITYPSCIAQNPTNDKFLKSLQAATGEQIRGIPYLVVADNKGRIIYAESGMCDKQELVKILTPLMK